MKTKTLFLVGFAMFLFAFANGQSAGDFRSVISGQWSDTVIWQSFNGSKWIAASSFPGFADGKITISSGDSVVSNKVLMVDQVVVSGGGTLLIKIDTSASRFILHNGIGADLICNGIISVDPLAEIINDTTPNASVSSIVYNNIRLTNNGGVSPSITFNGTSTQRIIGNGYMGPVIVNNTNNIEINGSTSVRSIRFLNGKILVRGAGRLLVDQYGSTFLGQNASRFIDGIVICIIYDTGKVSFVLPVGKGNNYLPMTFSVKQDAAVQTGFLINIVDSAPASRILPITLDKVSTLRYYKITRLSSLPSSNIVEASLKLSYNASDSVTNKQNLRMAKSVANKWIDLGGIGSSQPIGVISSAVNFTSFGDFVLANAVGGSNPLKSSLRKNEFPITQNESSIQLFPNPAKDNLNIQFENRNIAAYEISIFNLQGIKLLTKNSAKNKIENIQVGELSKGFYLLKIRDLQSGKTVTKKFLKV